MLRDENPMAQKSFELFETHREPSRHRAIAVKLHFQK